MTRLRRDVFGWRSAAHVAPGAGPHNTLRKALFAVVVAMVLAGPTGAARASDLGAFNAAVADAYRHYRSAVSYLRTGNTALVAIELEAAAGKWADVTARFAGAPPDAFADDPAWAPTLTRVGERLRQALAAVDGGDLAAADEALAPVRAELGALRRRNGVVVFSDRVDEVTAAMDRLWRFRHEPPDMNSAAALRDVRSGTAVFEYLLRRCREAAPAALNGDPEFVRFLDDAAEGVEHLWQAVESKDQARLVNTLRELRAIERLFYLRFG